MDIKFGKSSISEEEKKNLNTMREGEQIVKISEIIDPQKNNIIPKNIPSKTRIISIYIIGILLWIFLLYIVNSRHPLFYSPVMCLIATLPILILLINIYFVWKKDMINEPVSVINQDNLGILVGLSPIFPIFFLIFGDKGKDDPHFRGFTSLMILGFITSLIATYTVWADKKWEEEITHVKTIPYTYAITLFFMSFIYFFSFVNSPKLKVGRI